MHELSIAISLVEAAQDELEKLGPVRAVAIHLDLGQLSGVVRDALEFSYEVACQNTALAGSRLIIKEIPVMVECPSCGGPQLVVSLQDFRCAQCGSIGGRVVQGRELQLAALEIEESTVPPV